MTPSASRKASERQRPETDVERELRLAKQDIDTPRPQFWTVDVARYKAAKAAYEASR